MADQPKPVPRPIAERRPPERERRIEALGEGLRSAYHASIADEVPGDMLDAIRRIR